MPPMPMRISVLFFSVALLWIFGLIGAVEGAEPDVRRASAIDCRVYGNVHAALRLELVVDLYCDRCADRFSLVVARLMRVAAHCDVCIVLRFRVRRNDSAGHDVVRHILGCADFEQLRLVSSLVVGSPEGRTWAQLRGRLREIVDVDVIETAVAVRAGAIDVAMKEDVSALRGIAFRVLPCIVMRDRNGREYGRWEGESASSADLLAVVQGVLLDAARSGK